MRRDEVIKILLRMIENTRASISKYPALKERLEGEISGMRAALFFLGEKEAVTDHKRTIESLDEPNQGG